MSCDAAVRLEALVIQSLFIVLPQRGPLHLQRVLSKVKPWV